MNRKHEEINKECDLKLVMIIWISQDMGSHLNNAHTKPIKNITEFELIFL